MNDRADQAVADDVAAKQPVGRRSQWSWVTETRLTYWLKLLLVIVLALYLGGFILSFLERIHTIVLIVLAAIFFAYLIYPIVDRLRRNMHLVFAILLVYAVMFALVIAAGSFLVPHLMDDVSALVTHYPDFAKQAQQFVNDPNNPILAHLPPSVRTEAIRVPEQVGLWIRVHALEAATHAVTILIGTAAAIATFIIVPLLTAYILLDLDRLKRSLSRVIPPARWQTTLAFMSEVDAVVGGFIRGQVLVALCVGVMLTIVLLLLHVRYAFLLGLVAAIGDLIPYIGAVLVFVPSVTIAFLGNGAANALFVAIAFVVIYEIEGHLLAPMIVSTQVKLSPLVVLIVILIGADLGGVLGMVVAVPIAGVLRAIVLRMVGVPPSVPAVADKPAVPANLEAP